MLETIRAFVGEIEVVADTDSAESKTALAEQPTDLYPTIAGQPPLAPATDDSGSGRSTRRRMFDCLPHPLRHTGTGALRLEKAASPRRSESVTQLARIMANRCVPVSSGQCRPEA
jgi:hypothetical protein